MINFVLIHIGNDFPKHIYDCISQIEIFNRNSNIFLLMNNFNLKIFDCNIKNLIKINIDDISNLDRIEKFNSISYLSQFGNNNFWHITCQRLFYIEEFMRLNNIENVIHIENDVLIYEDFSRISNIFKIFFNDKIALNPLGPKYDTAACIYIYKYDIIKEINDLLIHYLSLDIKKLQKMTEENLINEMVLLKFISKKNTGIIDYMPLEPIGEFSRYLDSFNSLFDSASWGQFVGGTPHGHLPGCSFDHHWIGSSLKNNIYNVIFDNDKYGRKVPYVVFNHKKYKLNNLHIHCKKLKDFM